MKDSPDALRSRTACSWALRGGQPGAHAAGAVLAPGRAATCHGGAHCHSNFAHNTGMQLRAKPCNCTSMRAIARNCVSPAPRPARCPSYFQRQTSGARARAHAGDDRRCLQLSRFHADSTPSPIIVLDMPMHINNIDNTISISRYTNTTYPYQ